MEHHHVSTATGDDSRTGSETGLDAGTAITSGTPTASSTPERQPSLPGITDVPLQFRLSATTCRIGLAGVAAARRQLAEQAARREAREAAAPTRHRGPSQSGQRRAA